MWFQPVLFDHDAAVQGGAPGLVKCLLREPPYPLEVRVWQRQPQVVAAKIREREGVAGSDENGEGIAGVGAAVPRNAATLLRSTLHLCPATGIHTRGHGKRQNAKRQGSDTVSAVPGFRSGTTMNWLPPANSTEPLSQGSPYRSCGSRMPGTVNVIPDRPS